jgi:hypothetical protein
LSSTVILLSNIAGVANSTAIAYIPSRQASVGGLDELQINILLSSFPPRDMVYDTNFIFTDNEY